MSVGRAQVTDDGRLLAYTTDNTGFRDYTLHIKDLHDGQASPEKWSASSSVAWAADNKTLFYATTDHAKRPHQIWRHTLGDGSDDRRAPLRGEGRALPRRRLPLAQRRLPASSRRAATRPRSALPAGGDAGRHELRLIAPRVQDQEYAVDHRGDLFYILTNDQGRNNRLVTAPVADPRPGELEGDRPAPRRRDARRLRPLRATGPSSTSARTRCRASASRTSLAGGFTGSTSPRRSTPSGRRTTASSTRRPSASSTSPSRRRPPSTTTTWRRSERKLLKQREVLGGYDPSRYTSERRYATASDGTKVPISLVYKKGFVADGKAPLLLTAYGSYGASNDAGFDSTLVSLLDRGRRLRRRRTSAAAATSARSGTTRAA